MWFFFKIYSSSFQSRGYQLHLQQVRVPLQCLQTVPAEELVKLFCSNFSQDTQIIPAVLFIIFRSNHRRCSVKERALKKFANFIGKHLCRSLYLIVTKACDVFKKKLQHCYFSVKFAKFLRTHIFYGCLYFFIIVFIIMITIILFTTTVKCTFII